MEFKRLPLGRAGIYFREAGAAWRRGVGAVALCKRKRIPP